MAEGDWLDIRGWVEALSFAIADNTVGMSRFWRQKGTTADILTELIMAVVVFGLIMTTMLALLWIERKFFARIMDRRGATMAMRSLWVGEGALAGSRVVVCERREVCFVDVDARGEVLGVGDVKQRVEDGATSERELSADRPLEPCVEEVDVVVTFATIRWAYR